MPLNKNQNAYKTPINPIIGDESFQKTFGCLPDKLKDQDMVIQTHLKYAEHLLSAKDTSNLSSEARKKREAALNLLNEYWNRGIFPRNNDHPDERLPCFIDKDQRICAVGFLVEKTAGLETAQAINSKYQYSFVMDMEDAFIDSWIQDNGFSKIEIAMI